MFRMQVQTENAAFAERSEIVRILREIADNIENWDGVDTYRTIFDVNSNSVGMYRYMNKDMKDIKRCIICGKNLLYPRQHVDTCSQSCFKTLLKQQRQTR